MSAILSPPVWLTGQTADGSGAAARAKRLQSLLAKVSDAALSLARSATVGRLDIGRYSAAYIRLQLKGATDPGILKASRAQALKRIQCQLDDALGNQEAPEIEDCMRLYGVASVYGMSEAKKLGIGQLRYLEPTVKRATGKDAKPESWAFKPNLQAGAVDALQALFSALASGEKVLTAAETSVEVQRILGRVAASDKPALLTLTNGVNGAKYQVERLRRSPGEYAKGFRLTLLDRRLARPVCHTHQLPDGRHECSCTFWAQDRACEHTKLLAAAGLLDEPVNPDDVWDLDEIIKLADVS